MKIDSRSAEPIFLQIARELEDAIFKGVYSEGDQIPSTNELSALLTINPQTVLKGMTILVNEGIIYKKRGLGMFVTDNALTMICQKRMENYRKDYILPLVSEAKNLNISMEDLVQLLKGEYENGDD